MSSNNQLRWLLSGKVFLTILYMVLCIVPADEKTSIPVYYHQPQEIMAVALLLSFVLTVNLNLSTHVLVLNTKKEWLLTIARSVS
jgi:hypothetical protein